MPLEFTYLETIATVYRNTNKHIVANPISEQAARYYVELGEAAGAVFKGVLKQVMQAVAEVDKRPAE